MLSLKTGDAHLVSRFLRLSVSLQVHAGKRQTSKMKGRRQTVLSGAGMMSAGRRKNQETW